MEVYVIPTGRERYELYCESPAPDSPTDGEESGGSWLSRLRQRFAQMVDEAEARDGGAAVPAHGEWWERLQTRLMAWVAERVAEQRLLWNLRREQSVTLVHPNDLSFDEAQAILQRMLKADHDRHRIWLAIDGVLMAISGPLLFFVPGPNIVAYYFVFRVVGHWFSLRGAAQGMYRVVWTSQASAPLTALRAALLLGRGARERAVEEIAAGLGLTRLASFVERVATR